MFAKTLLALTLLTASVAALRDPPFARDPAADPAPPLVAECTPVHNISQLQALSGWPELTEYLQENQLQNAVIGSGPAGSNASTVAACLARGPVAITAGAPRCTSSRRQTAAQNYPAGVVTLAYNAGFSTRVTMTTRTTSMFSPGVAASVDLALPAIGGGSVGMLAPAVVPNCVGENFTAIAQSSEANTRVSVYSDAESSCALRYSINSCSAPATGRVALMAVGWVIATDVSTNETVRVNLDVITKEGRASYMELEGNLEYHAAGGYEPYCNVLST
ncbi:hypothetical protein C8R46DRAFT_1108039 [Mycena filopes]|nr:hypothetical protein C8R46DRAFT_1108039 [Mycena filopes]